MSPTHNVIFICLLEWLNTRDLSNGNFTKDNHKKLTGGDVDVPIYEAKMTKNTRLVVCWTSVYMQRTECLHDCMRSVSDPL